MSRSRKKHPLYKIGDKSLKKLYNRRFRRRKELDYPSGNAYRKDKNNNSWEICDWLFGEFTRDDIYRDKEMYPYPHQMVMK